MENAEPQDAFDPEDDVLVAQTQNGDPSAYDELVRRYQKRVYSVIYNMTSNHADTNDLMMETFAKAYKGIHGFKRGARFYTWLYRIAVNQTINFLKRNKNRSNLSLDNEDENLQNRSELIDTSVQADAERQNELQELQKKLNQSLMRLSEQHRAVVTLADVQGLSHEEISKILGVSKGTVKSRLFYAHQQLQKFLREYRQ
ncbi:MAG: sigma-70 family RNA polymerase sigma factor [Verrucomicrobiota bacterium]